MKQFKLIVEVGEGSEVPSCVNFEGQISISIWGLFVWYWNIVFFFIIDDIKQNSYRFPSCPVDIFLVSVVEQPLFYDHTIVQRQHK